jgi:hypothetical protein
VSAPGVELDALYHPGVTGTPSTLTLDEVRTVLEAAGWPAELIPEAVSVAWCESRFSPGAVGDGGSSLGLFQLWAGWFPYAGVPVEYWSVPVANARVALAVALRDIERYGTPWYQWSCRP